MASLETGAIIKYLDNTGVPFTVTAVTGQYVSPTNPCYPHVPTSYHCRPGTSGPGLDGKGLAVDVAYTSPTVDSQQLLRIFAQFGPVESRLAELIYAGAPYNIKDGKRVPPYATSSHHNHVHVAVEKGTFLVPLGVKPMFDPALVLEPIAASCKDPATGGVWLVSSNGAVYAFEGAPYYGGPEGHDYWGARKVAGIEAKAMGYTITATTGETYHYGP